MDTRVWRSAVGLLTVLAGLVAVPGEVGATTAAVATEAEYRAALTALSADGSGPHTITLTADLTITGATDPTYTGTQPLTVEGDGHVIDGGGARRALLVDVPVPVVVEDLVARDGRGDFGGGAIASFGPLTVVDSTFAGNRTAGNGGALDAFGLTVIGSGFTDNRAGRDGGAVNAHEPSSTSLTIESSTFVDNRAGGEGGAANGVETTVTTSLFTGNRSVESGGGLFARSGAEVETSTFAANRSGVDGGGVASEGRVLSTNSTFTENVAGDEGGGIVVVGGLGTVDLTYVTLAGNSAPQGAQVAIGRDLTTFRTLFTDPRGGGANCENAIGGANYSYSTDDTCSLGHPTNVRNGADPRLGPLQDNGGPTPTRFPGRGSPVLDAVACDPTVAVDQRGVTRPQDGIIGGPVACDIGAVEAGPREPLPPPPLPPTGPVPGAPGFTG